MKLFKPLYPFGAAAARKVGGGHGKVARAGRARGSEFRQRVEDFRFPKKTGAVI